MKELLRRAVRRGSHVLPAAWRSDFMRTFGIGYLEAEPWTIEAIEAGDVSLAMRGWALPPLAGLPARFTWNGRPFDTVVFPKSRPDVEKHFLTRHRADESGFSCSTAATPDEIFPDGFLEVSYGFRGRPQPFAGIDSWFLCDPRREVAAPEPERLRRVIGNDNQFLFFLGGSTDFKRLQRICEQVGGVSLREASRVLDWGVGCGRVARYFHEFDGVEFHGADIDADNVAWCAANLRGRFRAIPLMPPTDFPDGHFDVVYGISVFTHLRESVQDAWLRELGRITKRDGLVIVTVHGETAIDYGGIRPEARALRKQQVREEGLVITSGNDQISAVVDSPDYYLNVDHSRRYIRRHWGRFMDVVAILPGAIGTHDIVVLRNGRAA